MPAVSFFVFSGRAEYADHPADFVLTIKLINRSYACDHFAGNGFPECFAFQLSCESFGDFNADDTFFLF